jgi:hypothetical protein
MPRATLRSSTNRGRKRTLLATLSCVMLLGCDPATVHFGEIEPLALANVYFEKSGVTSVELGSYCTDLQSVTQGEYAMPATDGYRAVWVTSRDQLVLRLVHGEQVVDEHTFDQAFLDSGQFERLEFTLSSGEQLAYIVWGADSCEQCPPYAPGGETCFPDTHTKPGTVKEPVPGVIVNSAELGASATESRPRAR